MTPFQLTVKEWVESKDTARRELASAFLCRLSEIDSWWIGTRTLHPVAEATVMSWIRRQPRE